MQTSKDLRQRKLGKELMEEQEMIEGIQKVSNHLPQLNILTGQPFRNLIVHLMLFAMICVRQRILETRPIERCKTWSLRVVFLMLSATLKVEQHI